MGMKLASSCVWGGLRMEEFTQGYHGSVQVGTMCAAATQTCAHA
jgi:hypothetical protein